MSTDGPTRGDAQLNLMFPENGRTEGGVMWIFLTVAAMK